MSSDRATALNPFGDGPVNGPGVLDLIKDKIKERVRARTLQANVVSDGPLFNLFGQTIRGAVGVDYRSERFRRASENKQELLVENAFRREVIAAFGELRIPLIEVANALQGIRSLDISLSIRHDHYKDEADKPIHQKRPSQSTTNPRAGVAWSPVEGVRIGGSYGTSFRAPRLDTLASIPEIATVNYIDPSSPTGRSNGLIQSGVNPNIKSETADTWSVMAELSPIFAPNMRLNVSYFNIDFKDQVGQVPNITVVLSDPGFSNLVIRNPTLQQIRDACGAVAPSRRPADTTACVTGEGVEFIIDNRITNMARTKTDGLDIQFTYAYDNEKLGNIIFSLNSTVIFNHKQAATDNSDLIERKNTPGYPVDLRARGNVTWLPNKNATVAIFANYVDGYHDDLTGKKIDSWTTVDLTVSYQINNLHVPKWMQDLMVQLSVQNLFDKNPPFYDNPSGLAYDTANADPLGRFISFTIRKAL